MLCRHLERERIFGQRGGRESLISCKSETAPPLQIYDRSPGRHFANPTKVIDAKHAINILKR